MKGTREKLVDAARRRLISESIKALRSIVTASSLAKPAGVSRDTAYRAFADDSGDDSASSDAPGEPRPRGRRPGRGTEEGTRISDAILVETAASLPLNLDWQMEGSDERGHNLYAANKALKAYQDSRLDHPKNVERSTRMALQAIVESYFTMPATPVSLMLSAASIAASDAWQNEQFQMEDEDQQETARMILAHRRMEYERITTGFLPLLREWMSHRHIRPRSTISVERLIALMRGMVDGAVLRTFVEPDLLPTDLVVDAMLKLAEAFSEPVSYHHDPRRPDTAFERKWFDDVLAAAAEEWQKTGACPAVDEVASTVEPPGCFKALDKKLRANAVRSVFPTDDDLADSIARAAVIDQDGGADDEAPPLAFSKLRDTLQRLSRATVDHPGLATTLRERRTPGFLHDLGLEIDRILDLEGHLSDTEQLADQLIELALGGNETWTGVVAALGILERTPVATIDERMLTIDVDPAAPGRVPTSW